MNVIVVLISASLLVAIGFLISFFWAVKSGQYDDDYTPSVRMLFDNEPIKEEINTTDKRNTVSNIKLQNDL